MLCFSEYIESVGVFGQKLKVRNLTEHVDLSDQKVAKSGACD